MTQSQSGPPAPPWFDLKHPEDVRYAFALLDQRLGRERAAEWWLHHQGHEVPGATFDEDEYADALREARFRMRASELIQRRSPL
jgi:hypothetical protein